MEKILPNQNFISSKKKIYELKNFDFVKNDLEELIFEIGDKCNVEINIETKTVNGFKEILIFIENKKENGYFFKISTIDEYLFLDFAILKFLEIEFNELFQRIKIENIIKKEVNSI